MHAVVNLVQLYRISERGKATDQNTSVGHWQHAPYLKQKKKKQSGREQRKVGSCTHVDSGCCYTRK